MSIYENRSIVLRQADSLIIFNYISSEYYKYKIYKKIGNKKYVGSVWF